MRIALVCPYDLEAPGGVQVHVTELAQVLEGRGHETSVLGPGKGGLGRTVRIPYRGTVAPIAPSPTGIRRARAMLDALSPDVVHVHEPFTPSASTWATLASRVPVVATFHAWLDRSRLYELATPLLGPVRRRLAATIAVSEAAARFVRRAMPELDPVIVPNGLSVTRFASAVPRAWPPGRRIAWVHRLDAQKGFPVMVDAFGMLAAERSDLRLTVGGDGGDRGAVATLDVGTRERVTMLGRVPHADVPDILAGADVAVAAATGQESFGYSVVEAMAAGVAVVATDIEGYREVATNDVDSLLVPPGDPRALADAVARVLDDGALRERLATAGRARAASFDWSTVVERVVHVYDQAIAAGPVRPSLR